MIEHTRGALSNRYRPDERNWNRFYIDPWGIMTRRSSRKRLLAIGRSADQTKPSIVSDSQPLGGRSQSGSADEHTALARIVRQVFDRVITRDPQRTDGASRIALPEQRDLPTDRDAVMDICRLAVQHAWDALSFDADDLPGTDVVVTQPQLEARQAVAQQLLRGQVPSIPDQYPGIRLAARYVVVLTQVNAQTAHWDDLIFSDPHQRHHVLFTQDREMLVLLLPIIELVPVQQLTEVATKALRGTKLPPLAAVGYATAPEAVSTAADEAREVFHVASSLGFPAGYYQIEDVPVEVALMRSPDLAAVLARQLSPLVTNGAPLIDTLRVYLDKDRDRHQSAEGLHIHLNTLDYRLRRIRDLTGLSPTSPRDIQTLGTALIAWRMLRKPIET